MYVSPCSFRDVVFGPAPTSHDWWLCEWRWRQVPAVSRPLDYHGLHFCTHSKHGHSLICTSSNWSLTTLLGSVTDCTPVALLYLSNTIWSIYPNGWKSKFILSEYMGSEHMYNPVDVALWLTRYWCMRFKGKHNYFKDLSQKTKCFKNIAKSLAHRHQKLVSYQLSKSQSLIKEMEIGKGEC